MALGKLSQDDRFARLPAWAKLRISVMEQDLDSARRRLAEGPTDSDTFADPHYELVAYGASSRGYVRGGRPLGKGTQIRFHTGDKYDDFFDVKLDDGVLRVSCGAEILSVTPWSSNVLHVRKGKF